MNNPNSKLVPHAEPVEPNQVDHDELVEVGQWYWLKTEDEDTGKMVEVLTCVTHLGSNFAKLEASDGCSWRVHLEKEFEKETRRELSPDSIIRGKVEHYQATVRMKLQEIKEVTQRLGVIDRDKIAHQTAQRGLAALSQTADTKAYKRSLIRAKDKQLPKLFEEVESANRSLTQWMKAQTLPMMGAVEGMKDCIEKIDDRIFNISLYAGLTEDVEKISNGEPADIGEKLRLMQRRLYMDEECLLDYQHGGMDHRRIRDFDRWLAKPKNRDRILPFPRCMVAFRVRRNKKERDDQGNIGIAFINFELAKCDEWTFLYIRNGDRLYRMDTQLEFDELIFPGIGEFNLSEPMMIKGYGSSIREVMPKREYESRLKDERKEKRLEKKWAKENPDKDWHENPHRAWGDEYDCESWQPFDKGNVYFDDAQKEITDRIKKYNRIALIVQGLLDRSEVLHPHPPVQLWKPEGFAAFLELIYDGTQTLSHGAPPNFKEYRQRGQEKLKAGSVTIGQDDYWQRREAEKYQRTHYVKYQMTHHKPWGNPGPGEIATIQKWHPRVKKATFRWIRKRQNYSGVWGNRGKPGDPMPCSTTIPADSLFNVSAYKTGDYLQFFQDPRTRAEYLKWAPLLLAAEEYHAGNLRLNKDGEWVLKKKRKPRQKRRKERKEGPRK